LNIYFYYLFYNSVYENVLTRIYPADNFCHTDSSHRTLGGIKLQRYIDILVVLQSYSLNNTRYFFHRVFMPQKFLRQSSFHIFFSLKVILL